VKNLPAPVKKFAAVLMNRSQRIIYFSFIACGRLAEHLFRPSKLWDGFAEGCVRPAYRFMLYRLSTSPIDTSGFAEPAD
jgi:hypothetical protein